MVTATQSLTDDMIELFAAEVGAEIRLVNPGEEQEVELQKLLDLPADEEEAEEDLEPRPPVITVMGHVDHGKTKLLDQNPQRERRRGEAGGITQHIGAYQTRKNGRLINFIDTRATRRSPPCAPAGPKRRHRRARRGRDDGVMPQTVEALNHAKAAGVPIVVAINKVDREQANPDRVMQQLSEHGLVPTQWNGDTEMVQVSALQNLGIDDLLDTLLITADVEELTANPNARAQGVVLEAHLDVGRGPVATVLVQKGTLKVGDPLVAGRHGGRVRALINDKGEQIKEAGPSMPVEVLGLSEVADAGDDFVVAPEERVAATWPRRANTGNALPVSGATRMRCRAAPVSKTSSSRSSPARRPPQPRVEGRRHRFARSAHGEPAQARAARREARVRASRRWWHHRERHPARGGVQRHDHRLQRATRSQCS